MLRNTILLLAVFVFTVDSSEVKALRILHESSLQGEQAEKSSPVLQIKWSIS